MGWAVRNIASQTVREFQRWNVPDHDASIEEIIEIDDLPIVQPVPVLTCSPLQARRALRQYGVLELVLAALAVSDEETQEAWEYATEIRRDNPLVCGVASAAGLTSPQVDDLFRLAKTL